MWRGWAHRVLAILLSLALLSGGVAAARALAVDIPAPVSAMGANPGDGLSAPLLSLPKVVEAQSLRIQVQPPKRDPRPDPGTGWPTLLLLLAVAASWLPFSLSTTAGLAPIAGGLASPRGHLGSRCPTGPPRAAGF